MDDLSLVVGAGRISGWTGIRVTRGIERIPSYFDISLTENFPGEASAVPTMPGDQCQVRLGDDLVVTGYIDRYLPRVAPRQHEIRIVGRGKCQDLVDCAAEWPNSQINGASALGVAQRLGAPYGISVSSDQDAGPAIPQFSLMRGESAWEIIERVCRHAALLAYELADGSLFLTRGGVTRAASGFVEGRNVQDASANYAMDQRYSIYEAYYLAMNPTPDVNAAFPPAATVYDPGVKRHRKHIIICEQAPADFHIAEKRATWEAARRAARGLQIRVKTDSWRDAAGALWQPNTLVPVDIPSVKCPSQDLLVGEVTYIRDGKGTSAELVLMPPAAFAVEPVILQQYLSDAGTLRIAPANRRDE